MSEFEDSKDKTMMGAERRTMVMTEQEKMLTAYHEGGHAIVALNVVATELSSGRVTNSLNEKIVNNAVVWRCSTAHNYFQEKWLAFATEPRSFAGASFL